MSLDENKRADAYEKALTAFYGHPSVEGILIWGFWDQAHWRGEGAALVKGNDFEVSQSGRRDWRMCEIRLYSLVVFSITPSLKQIGSQVF